MARVQEVGSKLITAEETEMPRSRAIQSERTRGRSPAPFTALRHPMGGGFASARARRSTAHLPVTGYRVTSGVRARDRGGLDVLSAARSRVSRCRRSRLAGSEAPDRSHDPMY